MALNSHLVNHLTYDFRFRKAPWAIGLTLIFCYLLQQIDGESFLLLTQADIVQILRVKLGPAIKIYNSIQMIKNNA